MRFLGDCCLLINYNLIDRYLLKFFSLINTSLIINAHLLTVITNFHLPNIILEAQILHQGNQRLDDGFSFLVMMRLARYSFDLLCSVLFLATTFIWLLYECWYVFAIFARRRYLLLIVVRYRKSLFYKCVSSAIYETRLAVFVLTNWWRSHYGMALFVTLKGLLNAR